MAPAWAVPGLLAKKSDTLFTIHISAVSYLCKAVFERNKMHFEQIGVSQIFLFYHKMSHGLKTLVLPLVEMVTSIKITSHN